MKKILLASYAPLITIIIISILSALALLIKEGFSMILFMKLFMGVFLVLFSSLKLFDLKGFAVGFSKYDLLAKKCKSYGYAYPFLELILALGYLSNGLWWGEKWLYIATIVVMGFSALGVSLALFRGLDTHCACLGSTLKVPLSEVAIIENISMLVMAILLLIN